MTDNLEMSKIDLTPHDWEEVKRILNACVPEYDVLAFGSRIEWTAKPYSDLDLAIITKHPLTLSGKSDIKAAFDESDLTIKVDIIDWASSGEKFRKIIKQKNVLIQKAAGVKSQ